MYEQNLQHSAVNFTEKNADPRLTELRRRTEARLDVRRITLEIDAFFEKKSSTDQSLVEKERAKRFLLGTSVTTKLTQVVRLEFLHESWETSNACTYGRVMDFQKLGRI